jgi:hypothetical protein
MESGPACSGGCSCLHLGKLTLQAAQVLRQDMHRAVSDFFTRSGPGRPAPGGLGEKPTISLRSDLIGIQPFTNGFKTKKKTAKYMSPFNEKIKVTFKSFEYTFIYVYIYKGEKPEGGLGIEWRG